MAWARCSELCVVQETERQLVTSRMTFLERGGKGPVGLWIEGYPD